MALEFPARLQTNEPSKLALPNLSVKQSNHAEYVQQVNASLSTCQSLIVRKLLAANRNKTHPIHSAVVANPSSVCGSLGDCSGSGFEIDSMQTAVKNSADVAHVFVDYSNISAGIEGGLNVENLISQVIELNLTCVSRFVAGSFPAASDRLWSRWSSRGYRTMVAPSGKEIGVDDSLHAQILRLLVKYPKEDYPLTVPTIVIVTGDGNSNGNKSSFIEVSCGYGSICACACLTMPILIVRPRNSQTRLESALSVLETTIKQILPGGKAKLLPLAGNSVH